jgi:hypothetical protein
MTYGPTFEYGREVELPALPPQGSTDRARRWRRIRRALVLPVAAVALSGCTLPNFGASKGVTTSSRSVYHLWQGFSICRHHRRRLHVAADHLGRLSLRTQERQHSQAVPVPPAARGIYTVVPILIVFGLFAATLVVENKETANPKTNVTINVNWRSSGAGSSRTPVRCPRLSVRPPKPPRW